MSIAGSRVGIVGGSIAGCAAAITLERAGCDVVVFERSSSALEDRGAGIAIPSALREELIAADYLDADYPFWRADWRYWVIRDDGEPTGRLLWRQAGQATLNNWSILWSNLRARVDDLSYRDGTAVDGFKSDAGGVTVTLNDGSEERFDVLVAADGYRSRIRTTLFPGTEPDYAGYVLWRGNYPESRLTDRGPLEAADAEHGWYTICNPGGHGVIYMIPGADNRADIGHRRVNWAIYGPTPAQCTFEQPGSVAPGDVDEDLDQVLEQLLDEHFPPWHASVIRHSRPEEISIQPIYDETVPSYVSGRVMLLGDAATVTRPHTGSGATKAIQAALALGRICGEAADWPEALAAYDAERTEAGNAIVELGRRIGQAQVVNTPDWAAMKPADFEQWTKDTLAGTALYFYGSKDESA